MDLRCLKETAKQKNKWKLSHAPFGRHVMQGHFTFQASIIGFLDIWLVALTESGKSYVKKRNPICFLTFFVDLKANQPVKQSNAQQIYQFMVTHSHLEPIRKDQCCKLPMFIPKKVGITIEPMKLDFEWSFGKGHIKFITQSNSIYQVPNNGIHHRELPM